MVMGYVLIRPHHAHSPDLCFLLANNLLSYFIGVYTKFGAHLEYMALPLGHRKRLKIVCNLHYKLSKLKKKDY